MKPSKKFELLAKRHHLIRSWWVLYQMDVVSLSEGLVSAALALIHENELLWRNLDKKVSQKNPERGL